MLKNITYVIAILFIGVFQANAQVNYLKPLITPFVEPDSIQKAGSGISQSLTIRINEFMASNEATFADESNEFEDWIEIHNYGDESVDLNGMYVSDDAANPLKFQLTASGSELIMPANTFLILWADDDESDGANHLNFKLSAGGESIILTGSDQVLIDQYNFGVQTTDISEGLVPGTSDWNFYTVPTPNAANGSNGLADKLAEPIVSVKGGLFSTNQTVSVNYPDNQAILYYTTTGKNPNQTDNILDHTLTIDSTTTLRIKAFRTGYLPSNTATHTYIFDTDFNLDIISIQSDPNSFFGATGIYDNENSGLEKEIHVEYFKKTGELGFEVNAGVKIHSPKGHVQKSLRLYTRPEYGDNEINYKLFDDKEVDVFKRLILRNGSNDSQISAGTHFKDAMFHQLFGSAGKNNHYSAYRPVHVYLNGLYWGIYNIRERQDKYYAKGVIDTEDVDLLERRFGSNDPGNMEAIEGSKDEFQIVDDFVKNNDMSIQANYEYVKTLVDIESYVDYYAFGTFAGNYDWHDNNVKWMKQKGPGHKWQWLMWDVEYGLGTFKNINHGKPEWPAILYTHTRRLRPGTPSNDKLYTYFFNSIFNNKEFRHYFVNRYADILNTTLRSDNILSKIADTKAMLEPDFDRQINRWGLSLSSWNSAIDYLNYYVSNRQENCRKNLNTYVLNRYFSDSSIVDSLYTIYVDVQPVGSGKIKINTIKPDTYPWDGIYFNSVPIQVTAIPNPGYQFSHWSEDTIESDWFQHLMTNNAAFTAFFEDEVSENTNDIVINEISYNQHASWETGDWLELKNAGNNPINLENWYILDEDNTHKYILPAQTIAGNGYLVIATDSLILQNYHPTVSNIANGLWFGLASGGDAIRLYNSNDELVDAVYYNNRFPWPTDADGKGPTLELDRNTNENSIPSNWFTYAGEYGTPGVINHLQTGIDDWHINQLQVSPNPFNNYIQLSGSHINSTWTICNLQGQIISVGTVNTSNYTIDLTEHNLADGTYLLKIETNTERTILPITKLNR